MHRSVRPAGQVYILIESQWNLKFLPVCRQLFRYLILIESQWNLQSYNVRIGRCTVFDINRITVEFKGFQHRPEASSRLHINRITVEFKGIQERFQLAVKSHINRITVEFKGVRMETGMVSDAKY